MNVLLNWHLQNCEEEEEEDWSSPASTISVFFWGLNLFVCLNLSLNVIFFS